MKYKNTTMAEDKRKKILVINSDYKTEKILTLTATTTAAIQRIDFNMVARRMKKPVWRLRDDFLPFYSGYLIKVKPD